MVEERLKYGMKLEDERSNDDSNIKRVHFVLCFNTMSCNNSVKIYFTAENSDECHWFEGGIPLDKCKLKEIIEKEEGISCEQQRLIFAGIKTGKRNYECTLKECPRCEKRSEGLRTFTELSSLMRHLSTKKFACKVCGETLSQKHDLKIHCDNLHESKQESENTKYICRVHDCRKVYKDEKCLKRHINKKHHKNSVNSKKSVSINGKRKKFNKKLEEEEKKKKRKDISRSRKKYKPVSKYETVSNKEQEFVCCNKPFKPANLNQHKIFQHPELDPDALNYYTPIDILGIFKEITGNPK